MALRIPETEQNANPIQDNYGNQKGSYVSELDQLKRLENLRENHPDAIAAREGLSSGNNEDLQSQEESPLIRPEQWANKVTPQGGQSAQQGIVKRFATTIKSRKKRAAAGGLLLGGGLIAAILLPILMLPLKMIGLYSNITTAASKIPASVIERQTERRTTQMFATWLIRKSAGEIVTDADTNLVFCKNGSIGCSLTATRINNYFDARFDLTNIGKVDSETGTRRVTITPKNRDSIGSKARAWTINVETDVEGKKLSDQIDHITSNKEMKILLRNHVNERMATKSVITRYIARKALMKRYGVTNWRAFEKTSNAIADKRSSFKASMIQNTVGKVSPDASLLLGCITGGATCDKLRDQIASKIDVSTTPKVLDDEGNVESPQQVEQRIKKSEAYQKVIGEVVEIPGEEKIMTRYISKQLIGKLAGGAGILGAVDMVMGAIETIDDGALENVIYTVRATAYVGYTFGDTAGIATNIEKVQIGDGDSDIMQIMAEQFEGVEESPVFQAETGLLESHSFSDGGFKRTCSDEKGKPKEVILTDSYVCPERQVVQDVTQFMNNPAGKTLGMLATIWNNSAGLVFDFLGELGNVFFEFFRINDAIAAVFGSSMTALAEWLIGLFFDVPSLGDEARGDQNYDALSAGVWISQNEMMENGNNGGDLLGAGGRVLSNEEVATIQAEQRNLELDHFNSQSFLARMFDTSLPNSFTNQFIARVPMATFTNGANILSLPSTAIASLSGTLSPATQAQAGPLNPHNLPLYGYTAAELDSYDDPSIFTDEYCKKSSADREASYGQLDGYPISGYTKTDPCALERMVVGNILHDMDVKGDPNSFEEVDNQGSSSRNVVGGARISESELMDLIKEYGLDTPVADGADGWEKLLESLTKDESSGWGAGALLNGEKELQDKNRKIKEYLNTAWIWFESGSGEKGRNTPSPYQANCGDAEAKGGISQEEANRLRYSVAAFCGAADPSRGSPAYGSSLYQAAGIQVWDRESDIIKEFKEFYSESELNTVLKDVIANSKHATNSWWDYNDSKNNTGLVKEYSSLIKGGSVKIDDIAPTGGSVKTDSKTQFLSVLLAKDPTIAAALNSYAVTDDDLLAHMGTGEGCGPGWGSYICKPERQLLSNMIYALWKYDSMYGTSSNVKGAGAGFAAIWGGGERNINYGFDQIPSADSGVDLNWYDHGMKHYGMKRLAHTGVDIPGDPHEPVYSPVRGIVVCAGNGNGEPGGGYIGCSANADYGKGGGVNCKATGIGGAGTIIIELTDEKDKKTGDILLLGHIAEVKVQVGAKVTPNQQVGTMGCMNGWHTHVEYYIYTPGKTPSDYTLVDARDKLK